MISNQLIIILIWTVTGFVNCMPRKIKDEIIEKLTKKKGESIAVDNLIRRYELEHQKLFKEEIGESTVLDWPALDTKNLSDYCKVYLQNFIPIKNTDSVTGIKMKNTLYYVKENTNITSDIVIVRCKIVYKSQDLVYYITRAPEPKCVYSLKSSGTRITLILNIVYKYCDFGDKPLERSLKRKRVEFTSKLHRQTGQPIAKDEYLMEYELEHQALFKKEGNEAGDVNCVPRRINDGLVEKFTKKKGEAIAVGKLIQEYELEHQKFYREETSDGTILEWPDLETKDLCNYCKKYLQHSLPGRNTGATSGLKLEKTLNYAKENVSFTSKIVIVRCKLMYRSQRLAYYITRAPNQRCVYALKSSGTLANLMFNIVHKYCDFENQPWNKSPKQTVAELTRTIHLHTGQPIAKDEYLLEYELEHQVLLKKESDEGRPLGWQLLLANLNVDSFCQKYLKTCAPGRNRDAVKGSWKYENLHYQKSNINDNITVRVIKCQQGSASKECYYLTKAPEPNCAFALLRQNARRTGPLVIIFKHCDFEFPSQWEVTTKYYTALNKNTIPKIDVREETLNRWETLQLLTQD